MVNRVWNDFKESLLLARVFFVPVAVTLAHFVPLLISALFRNSHDGEGLYGIYEEFKVMYPGLSFGEAQVSLEIHAMACSKGPSEHCCMDQQSNFIFTSFLFPMQRKAS